MHCNKVPAPVAVLASTGNTALRLISGHRAEFNDEMGDEMPHVYAARLEPEPEGGFTVTFPDIGYGATYGASRKEALLQAEDMLEEAILGMIAHNEEVPIPSPAKGRPVARLPALTAAKLELYRAMRQAGVDAAQLAQRLGWPPEQDHPHLRRLPRRPPRTARSRARRARPPPRRDLGTSMRPSHRDLEASVRSSVQAAFPGEFAFYRAPKRREILMHSLPDDFFGDIVVVVSVDIASPP